METDLDQSRPGGELTSVDKKYMAIAFAIVLLAAGVYVAYTGLIVFMGDSFLLANRAKHVADQFNLNLNNRLAPLVYPPLYAVSLAFAYRFDSPDTIFRVTLAIHTLLTALQVFPLFLLLRSYGRLTAKPACGLTIALALAPASLPYTSIMLTEVLYSPLLLWLCYFLHRAWNRDERLMYPAVGFAMAACMLTRQAASTVLLALAASSVILLWYRRADAELRRGTARGLLVAGLCFFALQGGWVLLERLFVHYEGFAPQFKLEHVADVVTDAPKLDLHANWLANCFFYLLTAPLSLAGAFTFVLFARRPALLRSDPLAVFFLLSMLVSSAVISLVTEEFWGGKELTWNRYVMPYVVFSSLMAIRYRDRFNRSHLFLASLVLGMAVMNFRPSNLACHFTDALAGFGAQRLIRTPDVLLNLAYFAFTVLGGYLWLRGPRGRKIAFSLTAAVWVLTHFAAAKSYRNSGDFNISNYSGAGKQAYELAMQHPGSKVYYDPNFAAKDSFAGLRLLYYWPDLRIEELPARELGSQSLPQGARLLFFSADSFAGHEPVAFDRGGIKLYQFDETQLAAMRRGTEAPLAAVRFVNGPGFPVTEIGEKGGRKFPVRWLRPGSDFFIESELPEVQLLLRLATHGVPRTAILHLNGQQLPETYLVAGDFWGTPETEAAFRLRLKPGRNHVQVFSKEPAGKLSDGREIIFLMIGDARAVRLPAQK